MRVNRAHVEQMFARPRYLEERASKSGRPTMRLSTEDARDNLGRAACNDVCRNEFVAELVC